MLIESFGGVDLTSLTVDGFWVVPDAGSLMLSILNLKGEKIDFLITQSVDIDDFLEDQIPGRIYVNDQLLDLGTIAEKDLMQILRMLIQNEQLGHPQGLAVITAQNIITFFESDQAIRLHHRLFLGGT